MKGRTYRYMTEKPLYPFGFGLSYTKFCFDSINFSSNKLSAGGCVKAKVTVTHIGKKDAEEVVQLYISKNNRVENEPFISLKGFRRVFIPAGRSKTVEFDFFQHIMKQLTPMVKIC